MAIINAWTDADIESMTMPALVGTNHLRAATQTGVDDRFFREVNHNLSAQGFLVTQRMKPDYLGVNGFTDVDDFWACLLRD